MKLRPNSHRSLSNNYIDLCFNWTNFKIIKWNFTDVKRHHRKTRKLQISKNKHYAKTDVDSLHLLLQVMGEVEWRLVELCYKTCLVAMNKYLVQKIE